ncbi:MAG: hypothetical protein Ct9H300mP12_11630 [Acidimicrobiales bacterium]|nr:MAG: hypothetical protein Ct9H300mP12_11630 [Acidimicrobiales bacterium]
MVEYEGWRIEGLGPRWSPDRDPEGGGSRAGGRPVTVLALCSVVVLVGINALFVATEFALVAARPTVLAGAAEGGSRAAARALRARTDLRFQMSGAQLGITLAALLSACWLNRPLEAWPSVVFVPWVSRRRSGIGLVGDGHWRCSCHPDAVWRVGSQELAIAAPERTIRSR